MLPYGCCMLGSPAILGLDKDAHLGLGNTIEMACF